MKILLTGNGGFVGSHLMDAFLKAGHEVIGIDNFSTKNSSPGYVRNHLGANKKFRHYSIDLKSKPALEEVFGVEKDIDIVCHQAAFGGVPQSLLNPVGYYENNLIPLINLLRLYPKARYIFASSSSVYGMLSPYALTKKACEDYLEMSGVNYIAFRYFNVFGDRQLPGPIVATMINAVNNGETVPLYGDTQRDFTYIKNIVAGNMRALELLSNPTSLSFICDLGYGSPTSISKLAKIIGCEVRQESARDGDLKYSCANTKDANLLLGGALTWSLEDGLDDMCVL